MLKSLAGNERLLEECYRRAAEARRMADAPGTTPAERADFIEIERSWMSLARRYATQGRA
jgi:hypothetical protein